jgi:hypothetical protein
MSPSRLLLVKVGTEPGLESIVDQLRQLLPKVTLFGVTTDNESTETLYDVAVAKVGDTTLGSYPELARNSLFVRPELYEFVMENESALIRMCERVALHDLTTVQKPHFTTQMFRNTFDDRQQLVLRQFAFWDHVFRSYEIDVVVAQNYGHNLWDFALETVARSHSIPYMFFHEVRPFLGSLYICESLTDLDDLSFGRGVIAEARSRGWYLGDSTERESQMLNSAGIGESTVEGKLEGVDSRRGTRLRFLRRVSYYSNHPVRRIRMMTKRRTSTYSSQLEERSVSTGNVPEKYVFMELQSQPNGTTARKGWMYADLREMVAHVAHSLPDGQSLVVRESSRQWSRLYPRRSGFWKSIAAVPKVVVVDSALSVDELVENASAIVETSYSTLAFKAASRGVPVVVLGHTHLRGILGIFAVGVHGDLTRAFSQAAEYASNTPSPIAIQQSIARWVTEAKSGTVEGALSSLPSSVVDRRSYIDRVTRNVAGVIAVWVLRKG